MATEARKVKDVIPSHAAAIAAERAKPKRAKKKKWNALSDAEKDALLKALVLEAGLLDES